MFSQDVLGFFRFDIECFLRQYNKTTVLYHPNPGNGGDSFIAVGIYQAFKRCGVEIEVVDLDSDVTDQVVFLSGGGNFVPLYTDIKTAYGKFLGRAAKCVLLPHTIRGNEDVISRLDDTCTVFCRDLISFKHVLAVNPSLDVRLSHDMAFHTDVQALLNDEAIRKAAQGVLTEKLNSLGLTETMLQCWPSVDMLRLDSESRANAAQSDVDVSDLFMLGVRPKEAEIAAWCFLKTISLAKHITTDRLHVGIAAAMLGVPCTLRDNSYGKNRSIYDHSLKYISINNGNSTFRFKPGTPSDASDKPQSLALSRQLDQKIEIFNAERRQLTSALDGAQEDLRKRDEALAVAHQQLVDLAIERENLTSELGQVQQELVERSEALAVAHHQLADLIAERKNLASELGQVQQELVERSEALAVAHHQLADLIAERKNLASELGQVQQELVERSEALAVAHHQLADLIAERKNLASELGQVQQELVERSEALTLTQLNFSHVAVERQNLVAEVRRVQQELVVERSEDLALTQQKFRHVAVERNNLSSELGQAREDFLEQTKVLAETDRALANAAADVACLKATLDRRSQALTFKIAHVPREFGRVIRKPFGRLSFHNSGKPRGWVRKSLFHSSGRVRGVFRRWVYNADGKPRRAFETWLFKSTPEIPSELLPAEQVEPVQLQDAGEASVPAILVASDFPPLYDQHSGGLRLKTLIEMIGQRQQPIIFASAFERTGLPGVLGTEEGLIHYEGVLRRAGVAEFTYGVAELDAFLRGQSLDIRFAFLSFPGPAQAFLPIVRKHHPDAKVIYDMVDFHAQRMEREAALKGDSKLAAEAAEMKVREILLATTADITVAVSADEMKALLELAPTAVIKILPNIFEVPAKAPPGPEGRRDLLFLGGFWHTPNGDAVKWFVESIWPLVSAAEPKCRFIIAGSNLSDDVRALSETSGVDVVGYVADLEPLYEAARVCVAPLRFGAGAKGKVGQSMAYGLPVVATSIGAEGMGLRNGEHLLIADDPDTFARHVIDLLEDDELWIKTQSKARDFVEKNFSVRALTERVEDLFHV